MKKHWIPMTLALAVAVAALVLPQIGLAQPASRGQATRLRVTFPGGHAQSSVFGLHGHVWEEQPYTASSTVLTQNNTFSEWHGGQHGHGPTNHFDALLQHGAGGAFGITGDFMFRDYANWKLYDGIWGIFRVVP